MRWAFVLGTLLVVSTASAEQMRFQLIDTGGNACCRWIQATGEITSETPKAFEAFLSSMKFAPSRVRLDSPGGNLIGGIVLGEIFRAQGIATEVGSSDPISITETPGICASACAYAFLGGVERSLDEDAKLGFHRFYVKNALAESSVNLFTGQDLDDAQKTTAALVFYAIKMGVDARLVTLATEAGPNAMRWIRPDEARELRVIYQPLAYKPWRIEAYRGGTIAISESNDGLKSIVVSCSKQFGPNVALINAKPTWDVASWFEQCRKIELQGGHPVFGTRIDPNRIQIIRRKDGSAIMRFRLPTSDPPLTSSELLTFAAGYPRVCSTNEYQGSRENFVPAVRLALRNCFQD